ncbi:MAG: type I pantothenate kinase [Propionibacteriaceae bacterium]|jgi:type I pantothenate kinase|nr:type I pantothenate kinase [Propionibacteriaceae bacterium]
MPDRIDSLTGAFLTLTRDHWAHLARERHLSLTDATLAGLRALGDPLNLDRVRQIYLPLTELINLYINNTVALSGQSNAYLGLSERKTPFIIGIAGSVAVGKSTTARLLRELLSVDHRVELVTTDGFLYPNHVLAAKGLMDKKGFPQSYDQASLLRFIIDVKSGVPEVSIPVYSHLIYDIVPDRAITVRHPDVLIVEGLNVLQPSRARQGAMRPTVSDFFDFSVYVDAPEHAIKQWFLDRFRELRATAFTDPDSYFRQFAHIPDEQALQLASDIWDATNGPNLTRNIRPTRERAKVVIGKGPNHDVEWIRIRKV